MGVETESTSPTESSVVISQGSFNWEHFRGWLSKPKAQSPDWKFIVSEGFEEAGRRIKAAVISYLMGFKGVDRTLKEMGDEDPGKCWTDEAVKLLRSTNGEVVEELLRSKKDSDETIQ
jgi:hypothetical protein